MNNNRKDEVKICERWVGKCELNMLHTKIWYTVYNMVDDMSDDNNNIRLMTWKVIWKWPCCPKNIFPSVIDLTKWTFTDFSPETYWISHVYLMGKSVNVSKPSLENYWYPRNKFYFLETRINTPLGKMSSHWK